MQADLVCATCFWLGTNQGEPAESLFDLVKRDRVATRRVPGPKGLFFSLRGVIPDRVLNDVAVAIWYASHQRNVLFLDGSRFELVG